MSNMEITFFRILREANVTDDMAQAAVESLEEHIAVKIKDANRSLEIRLNLLIAITTLSGVIGGYLTLLSRQPAVRIRSVGGLRAPFFCCLLARKSAKQTP